MIRGSDSGARLEDRSPHQTWTAWRRWACAIHASTPRLYAGTIKKVQIHISPSNLSASDQEKVRNAERDAALAIE
jgi:hypothetical protein